MSNLKLRLSVGVWATSRFPDHAHIEQISTDNQMTCIPFDGLPKRPTTNVSDPLSPGSTWETVTTHDVTDVGLLNVKCRLNLLTGDYYTSATRRDMSPPRSPARRLRRWATPKANCATPAPRRWEITLSWQDEFQSRAGSPFSYNVGLWANKHHQNHHKYHNPDRLISTTMWARRWARFSCYHVDGCSRPTAKRGRNIASRSTTRRSTTVSTSARPGGQLPAGESVPLPTLDGDNVISEGSGTVDDPRQAHHRQLLPRCQPLVPRGIQLMG